MSDTRLSHLVVERVTPQYWRVMFDHESINTISVDTVAELEPETGLVGRLLASFDKPAIAETKALVDAATLPDDAELPPALTAFFASAGRPAAQPNTR